MPRTVHRQYKKILLCVLLLLPLAVWLCRLQEQPHQPVRHGGGSITYAQTVPQLWPEQEAVLLDYMDTWYEALAVLEPGGLERLFTQELQAQANGDALQLQIALRQSAGLDYTLTGFSYELNCTSVQVREDGTVRIEALENSTQQFAAVPGVDAKRFNLYHHFTLEPTEEGWGIRVHYQYDVLQLERLRAYTGVREITPQMPPVTVEELTQDYIAHTQEYLEQFAGRAAEWERQQERTLILPAADHPYNREAAVAYAARWTPERSPDWPDYSRTGGNCQNYASQALLAGGIPMDSTGVAVWKWYGSDVANTPGAYGRSSSWSGVKAFIAYAAGNTGPGLVAVADAPIHTGQPGDLLHMGMQEDWRHTVVISQAVLDEQGRVQDYLVHSNTGDLLDFPASLYGYTSCSLTKIVGWND